MAARLLYRGSFCVVAVLIVSAKPVQAAESKYQESDLPTLIARIREMKGKLVGINPSEDQLAKKIGVFKGEAVPYLLPLLESKESAVSEFAGYVLRDQKGLTEEHLDALIAARRRGNGWIPNAIGRIGTPRAIQFLIDDLKANSDFGSNSQVVLAIESTGEGSVPQLVSVFKEPVAVDAEFSRTLCGIFSRFDQSAKATAVERFLQIARGKEFVLTNRQYAVTELGCLGSAARSAIPALRALVADESGTFAAVVDETIIEMGVPESVPLLVVKLRAKPDIGVMRDIAVLRDNGREAGPALTEFLSSRDPELRLGTASALGFIGYHDATNALMALLKEPRDWRLVYIACESLGRLRAQTAIPELESTRHWYPPVMDAARFAIKAIRREAVYKSRRDFWSDFASYESAAYEYVDLNNSRDKIQPRLVRGIDELGKDSLMKLEYEIETVSYGSDGEKIRRSKTHPKSGLRVPGGSILGSDRGEWGGELAYLPSKGPVEILLHENTEGIHRLPFGIIAVTGLGHMGTNRGALYLIVPVEHGTFKALLWQVLPGAPRKSGMLANGNLFVSTFGGDIIITANGQLEMASTANTKNSANP
jgi:HEAT repeat protein